MKTLILRILSAWAALRAGKVFPVDKIDVIASCQADAEIIANALALLKEHPENSRYYLNFENHKIVFAATLFAHVGGLGSY